MPTFVVIALLTVAVVADCTFDKRILLHSDTDIVQAIQALKADNALLHNKLATLESTSQNSIAELQHQNAQLRGSGSTYVRWGRTTCPGNGTTLAYAGYMGGSHHDHTGAAANYLCLTGHPTWDHYNESVQAYGKVYGVEYQFYDHRADGAVEFFGTNLYNQDAPCAVCHSTRYATLMIPGTKLCSPGWTTEYSGYLVSGYYYEKAASEYICLDRRPEVVVGGAKNDEENMLYFVEGVCGGALECPPYINGRELTCVVCTK